MHSSTLITFGEPNGDTAMSRTVSFPVAIAIRLVLEVSTKNYIVEMVANNW